MKSDYLKYWRVIRQYIKVRYNIGEQDLELLLFLYSEGYFKSTTIADYCQILRWDRKRLKRMIDEGWIELFRPKIGQKAPVYTLSYKANRMIVSIYKKLEGQEIPETYCNNPMFKKNVRYKDKVYRNMIKTMNEHITKMKLDRDSVTEHIPE